MAPTGVRTSLLDDKQSFAASDFGLDRRLTKAVAKLEFVHATLVQRHCIPLALQGKDLLVRARTGSGKTAAYALPLLHKLLSSPLPVGSTPRVRALVLVPTKELVEQAQRHISELMYYCRDVLSLLALGGGKSMNAQQALLRDVPDIVVSTPGRLVAHLNAGNLSLQHVESVVIDEADLVLSFGYGDDVRTIYNHLPKACQTFCMSATLSPELEQLKKAVLHNAAVVKLEEGETDGKLQQYYLNVNAKDKDLLLYALLKLGVVNGKVIFFVNSTEAAYRLKLFFEQFIIKSAVLNAQLPHNSRQHIIEEFNRGFFDYLIATDDSMDKDEDSDEEEQESEESDDQQEDEKEEQEDEKVEKPQVGAKRKRLEADSAFGVSRGVDFRGVTFVVNVDFPRSVRSYTHRIGRTARGGANGTALSLVCSNDENDTSVLAKVQATQQPVETSTNDVLQQPAQLDFDLKEIDCFRYRVEDVRRAVTSTAVREAQLADVKKEILNSDKLASHFEANPRELNVLQHDKAIGAARIQPHLATVPDYLVPQSMQASTQPKKKKPRRNPRARSTDGKKRTDNDPLHNFSAEGVTEMLDEKTPEDRISYGTGVGKSSAGRDKWKARHRKGKYNPRTAAKRKAKNSKGFSH